MAETKESVWSLILAPFLVFLLALAALYVCVKRQIRPTKRNKGKVVHTKPLTKKMSLRRSSGVMSSTEESSITIDLPVGEME